jgi:hypothetical protein
MARHEEVIEILEALTQDYFDNICVQLSTNKTLYPKDLATLKTILGPVTFFEFVGYVESMGEYELLED